MADMDWYYQLPNSSKLIGKFKSMEDAAKDAAAKYPDLEKVNCYRVENSEKMMTDEEVFLAPFRGS